jgi:hypothetical protein
MSFEGDPLLRAPDTDTDTQRDEGEEGEAAVERAVAGPGGGGMSADEDTEMLATKSAGREIPELPGEIPEDSDSKAVTGKVTEKHFSEATEHLFMTLCAVEGADLTHCGAFREVQRVYGRVRQLVSAARREARAVADLDVETQRYAGKLKSLCVANVLPTCC